MEVKMLEVGKKYKIERKIKSASLRDGEYTVTHIQPNNYFCVSGNATERYDIGWYTFTPIPEFKAGDLVDVVDSSESVECRGVKLLFVNDYGFAVESTAGNKTYFWKHWGKDLRPHIPQPQLEIGQVYKAVHKRLSLHVIGELKAVVDNTAELWPDRVNSRWAKLDDYTFTKLIESK
jgi:hypothetical protein